MFLLQMICFPWNDIENDRTKFAFSSENTALAYQPLKASFWNTKTIMETDTEKFCSTLSAEIAKLCSDKGWIKQREVTTRGAVYKTTTLLLVMTLS